MSRPSKFYVTLHCLDREVTTASPDLEPCDRGAMPPPELEALLVRFCELDAMENAHADPEIRIENGRERFIVKTGLKKLMLYDARDRLAPAQVVTPVELMAEIDGSAAAARSTAAPFAAPVVEEAPAYVPPVKPPAPPRPLRRLALLTLLCLLLAAQVVLWIDARATSADDGLPLQPLAAAELAATRGRLIGVFMTGSEPGAHGIALTEDGTIKLFRLNARTAPSVLFDTIRLGRRGPATVAIVERLGTTIEVTGADTLTYCGETFRRIP